MKKIFLIFALAILLSGCQSKNSNNNSSNTPTLGLSNPSSVFCEEQGGEVELVETEIGMLGMCNLPDGRSCEEWSYARGGCDSIDDVINPRDSSNEDSSTINSFEECAAAGNPIMESYPQQCRDPKSGNTFTEELTDEEKESLIPPSPPLNDDLSCENQCGDDMCQEIVCLGSGCPCAETHDTCADDCSL